VIIAGPCHVRETSPKKSPGSGQPQSFLSERLPSLPSQKEGVQMMIDDGEIATNNMPLSLYVPVSASD